MTNNDLNQIRIFNEVAELGSFTKAAESLAIEKSTVSTKIRQLESRLKIRLLQRTTRSVSLTEAGSQYLSFCQQALQALQQGDDFIAELSQVPSGKLRISTPHHLVEFIMESVLTPFLQQHPQVDLEVIESNQTVDVIADKFDLVIRSSSDKLEDSSLIYRKLFSSHWVLVASREFIAEHGRPTDINQLKQLASIGTINVKQNAPNSHELIWQGNKVVLNHRFAVNNMMAVKKAMLNHIGIAMIPRNMIRHELQQQQVEILLDDVYIPNTALYIIYPSRSGQPAKLKAFVSALIEWGERSNQ